MRIAHTNTLVNSPRSMAIGAILLFSFSFCVPPAAAVCTVVNGIRSSDCPELIDNISSYAGSSSPAGPIIKSNTYGTAINVYGQCRNVVVNGTLPTGKDGVMVPIGNAQEWSSFIASSDTTKVTVSPCVVGCTNPVAGAWDECNAGAENNFLPIPVATKYFSVASAAVPPPPAACGSADVKCEYNCAPPYRYTSGNNCNWYICSGGPAQPANSTRCSLSASVPTDPYDDTYMTINTAWKIVTNGGCTATKCQYECNPGYRKSLFFNTCVQNNCVNPPADTSNMDRCSTQGDTWDELLFNDQDWITVNACTPGLFAQKCEYKCRAGYHANGAQTACIPYVCTNPPANTTNLTKCSLSGDATDETGLAADTNWFTIPAPGDCSVSKCEYKTTACLAAVYNIPGKGNVNFPVTPLSTTSNVSCPAGYNGTASRTCSAAGAWGVVTDTCTNNCPVTSVIGPCGNITLPSTPVGTPAVSAPCGAGCSGNATGDCQANGTWANMTTVMCSISNCIVYTYSAHGVSFSIPNTPINNSAIVSCNTQIPSTSGTVSRFCQANGTWAGATADDCRCLSNTVAVPGGNVTIGQTLLGQVGTIACPANYSGTVSATCNQNGTWGAASNNCVLMCSNGIKDGTETGVDCGGTCMSCAARCANAAKDGDETAVDCGGASCGACPTPT